MARKLKEDRLDDQLDTLKRRFDSYEKETLPTIYELSKQAPTLTINGNGDPLLISKSLYKTIKYLI